MPRLIFDIETVGVDFNSLDEKSKELLLAYAEDDEDRQRIKDGLGFSPLTGQVVAIGILNPLTQKGAVYFLMPEAGAKDKKDNQAEKDGVQYIPCSSEKELLTSFWEVSSHYDQFVTFNGHSFDCPYLMIRSAILKIKPTVNLMHNRYGYGPHIDILDKLTNYGALRGKRGLHLWCRAFGIESPKDSGVTGSDVASLFRGEKYLELAEYCFDDVRATSELYDYWDKYLNIK